jgi:hypothetical protein
MVNSVLRGQVGLQRPPFPHLFTDVALYLAILGRPVQGVRPGLVGVLGQAGADPARKEDHVFSLGGVGFQANAAEEVRQEVEGGLESLEVPRGDQPIVRVEDGNDGPEAKCRIRLAKKGKL